MPWDLQQYRASAKKAASVALRVVGVLVALVSVVVGGTFFLLRTDWGGERLRRRVVSTANRQIQGSLEIKRLSFGGDRMVVWGVVLRDPDGQAVASVARAEVDVSLMRLVHKELRVTAVAVETPILDLVSGDQGSNLSRATAPRKKSEPRPPAARTVEEGWVVQMDRFDLRDGALTVAVPTSAGRITRVHLAELRILASVRYATGNGSLAMTLRLDGQSQEAPVGPIHLVSQVAVRGDDHRFDADGDLLGGTLKAHGALNSKHLDAADGSIAVAIPKQAVAGHDWGPLRIAATARPGAAPRLELRLAIPGVELAARDRGQDVFSLAGHLGVADLRLTGAALQALIGADLPALGGHGEIDFGVESVPAASPATLAVQLKGSFDGLRAGDNVVSHLTLQGQADHLTSRARKAGARLAITSLKAGDTQLRAIEFSASVDAQDVSADLAVAAPVPIAIALGGRLDDDQQGLVLTKLGVAFPEARWTLREAARVRFAADSQSLANLRLASDRQVVAIDGSRRGEEIDAHLSVTNLRLGHLPVALLAPALRLDGEVDLDIKADGQLAAPKVVARLDVRQGRYQGFSKVDAAVAATLHDRQVDGTVQVEAPFLTANADFKLPSDPRATGAPIDVRLDVKHLDVDQILRGAEMAPLGDGRANLKLRLNGSADRPVAELTVEAFDLAVNRPIKGQGSKAIDLGHARLQLTYADRDARGQLDFRSSHGGTLVADASTRIDLSYPRVTQGGTVIAKLPVRGKVVARDLDVAWVARFNPRVESLGGQVTADARLGGTVGDPQLLGDVHWKNGQVVATTPPPGGVPRAPAAPRARVGPSAR